MKAFFFCMLNLLPAVVAANINDWDQIEFRYVVVTNEVARYGKSQLSLEIRVCNEVTGKCASLGVTPEIKANEKAKALKLPLSLEVPRRQLEASLSAINTSTQSAKLWFQVKDHGKELGLTGVETGGPLRHFLDLAKVNGIQSRAETAKPEGAIELTYFEVKLTKKSNERIPVSPPASSKKGF